MFNDDLLFLEKVSSSSTWSGTRRGRERAEVSSLSPSPSLTLPSLPSLTLSLPTAAPREGEAHGLPHGRRRGRDRGGQRRKSLSLSLSHSLTLLTPLPLTLSLSLSTSSCPSRSLPLAPSPSPPGLAVGLAAARRRPKSSTGCSTPVENPYCSCKLNTCCGRGQAKVVHQCLQNPVKMTIELIQARPDHVETLYH